MKNYAIAGIGGAGGNTVASLMNFKMPNTQYIIINSDKVALDNSPVPIKISIKGNTGMEKNVDLIMESIEKSKETIKGILQNIDIVYLTAGLGGTAGTIGILEIAKLGIALEKRVVALVSMPFGFEGQTRMETAEDCLLKLYRTVDMLVVIPNDTLRGMANNDEKMIDMLRKADDVYFNLIQKLNNIL